MNAIYSINYLIFSVFLTLFMIEVGLALITLFNYGKYKAKINHYILPLWEITGTFAIFYTINFEATYPKLVSIVGTAFATPLLVAAIFVILRNIFLIFSEYIGESSSEHRFRMVYSLSTLIAAVLAASVLTSGLSGIGLNTSTSTLNSSFVFNVFNLMMLVAILLFSLSLANGLVNMTELSKWAVLPPFAAFVLAVGAAYVYLPGFAANIHTGILLIVISLILLVATAVLRFMKSRYVGALSIVVNFLLINFLGATLYPYILGSMNATSFMTSSVLAGPEIIITTIGGTFVTVSLLAFVYMNYIRSNKKRK